MRQVTKYRKKSEVQFAKDHIEKFHPGVTVWKTTTNTKGDTLYAVFRTDMEEDDE